MGPLVSVVIPIYNVEKYLDRCIQSVVDQSYNNLEIILVDDGSLDNCPKMCDEWARIDKRIKVVHKQNAGLGMARNTGLDVADGDYIFFFDSDDYVKNTIVEKCVKNAVEYGSDVVIYGRNDVYENGRIVPKNILPGKEIYIGDSIRNELLPEMFTYKRGFGVSAWGKMYNLRTLKKLDKRFVSECEIISEDAYFAVDLFSDISVATVLIENLYFYFKRYDSLSRVYKTDRQNKNDLFYHKTIDLIEEKKLSCEVAIHLTARYQMYAVATMKQIISSELLRKKKVIELHNIYKNQTLQKTLRCDIIKLHNKSLCIFFVLLKCKCYLMCDALLWIKNRKDL